MNKVLITGATGFIGSQTLPLLIERGYEVYALSSKKLPETEHEVTWIRCNILDSYRIHSIIQKIKPTHLLHFAWYVTPEDYSTSPENLIWVAKSLELVRRFQQCGGKRVVMAGSCFEYDWNCGFCDELQTQRNPETFYGICKNALQNILSGYSEKTGMSSAWGRVFFLYGPHEYPSRLVPSIIRSLLEDKPAFCKHGDLIRDYLYVKDIADAFVALLDSSATGGVNIASGQPIALEDIGNTIAEILNKRDLFQAGSVSNDSHSSIHPLLVANTARLKSEVGWEPKFSLFQGLTETIEWWKNIIERNRSKGTYG